MQFQIKRDILLKSLAAARNVIEKKNTLPILSNVLLEIKNKKLNIVTTDLDLIFHDEISDLKVDQEGSTTTSAMVLYDLLRKLPSNLNVIFDLQSENKLNISAENSKFNLLCLPVDNFPNFTDDFKSNGINLDRKKFLSLLNKTKMSMSNDETRHYLNGIFVHITESDKRSYLTGVATDSHRLSSSSIPLEKIQDFKPFILPKKAVGQNYRLKINKLVNVLNEKKIDCQFISASENIAWLLNIRGQDSEFTPIPNAYLTLDSNKKINLFCDLKKIEHSFKKKFKNINFIDIKYTNLFLAKIKNKKILIDSSSFSIYFENILKKNNKIAEFLDPIYFLK